MEVIVNNQSVEIPENCLLFEALKIFGISSSKGIAVAVNNAVVPSAQWNEFQLGHADKITLIRASQGG